MGLIKESGNRQGCRPRGEKKNCKNIVLMFQNKVIIIFFYLVAFCFSCRPQKLSNAQKNNFNFNNKKIEYAFLEYKNGTFIKDTILFKENYVKGFTNSFIYQREKNIVHNDTIYRLIQDYSKKITFQEITTTDGIYKIERVTISDTSDFYLGSSPAPLAEISKEFLEREDVNRFSFDVDKYKSEVLGDTVLILFNKNIDCWIVKRTKVLKGNEPKNVIAKSFIHKATGILVEEKTVISQDGFVLYSGQKFINKIVDYNHAELKAISQLSVE
ncbi:MAG: hypothetical protein H6578_02485 [Chitinophagales bacterium]|nr:hypothetical protein [Chitinophagales bacterium]